MSFDLISSIQVGKVAISLVNNLIIDSSYANLTSTCRIVIPRNVVIKEADSNKILQDKDVSSIFNSGDEVSVQLGYSQYGLKDEFKGYLRSLNTTRYPIVLECEDEMYKLKRNRVSYSSEAATLKDIVTAINTEGYETSVLDMQLGAVRISNASGAQVLQDIRNKFGIYSYFVGKVLHVGFAYANDYTVVKYDFEKNIKQSGSSLTYMREADVKLQVRVISLLPDGKKKVKVAGDTGGDLRTYHYYNVTDEAKLQSLADEALRKMKYDGFRGSFKAFGAPYIAHGDVANINDRIYTEHNGSYFADRIVTSFGVGGFERQIFIGQKAA